MAKNFREYESRVDEYRYVQHHGGGPINVVEGLLHGVGIFLGYLALVALAFACIGLLVIVFAS